MSSLRRRLIVGSATTTLVAVGLAAAAVAAADHVLTMRAVDQGLAVELRGARFRAIGAIAFGWGEDRRHRDGERERGSEPASGDQAPDEREPRQEDDELIAAWSLSDASRRYRSGTVDETLATALLAALPADGETTLRAPDGRLLRAARSTVDELPRFPRRRRGGEDHERGDPPTVLPIAVILAEDIDPVAGGLVQRRWLLAATVAAAAALAALGAWLLSRGLLRPLRQLGERIAATEASPAAEPIALDAPDELTPVIERLNELLERVGAAVARERRVNADIAHELRTPLAGLRSQLEFALQGQSDATELREAGTASLAIAIQMQELTENLLTLSRLDAGQVALRVAPLNPGDLVATCWSALEDRAEARGLALRDAIDPELELESDAAKLRVVISNLLGNAVAHAPSGGEIDVTWDDGALVVTNDAGGLDPERAAQATEPFWRGDAARTDTGLHCGLGLSIAQRLCAALGGELTVAVVDGRFEARAALPSTQ